MSCNSCDSCGYDRLWYPNYGYNNAAYYNSHPSVLYPSSLVYPYLGGIQQSYFRNNYYSSSVPRKYIPSRRCRC